MRVRMLRFSVGLGLIGGLLGLVAPSVADVLFDGPYDYPVGDAASAVAVGDVNGDLWPDLAVSNWDSDNVSLLLNNGDGTFAPAVHYATGRSAVGVALSDLNRDDWLDLAVTNFFDNNISVLLNNGDGTFDEPVNYDAVNSPHSIAVDDLNGDEWPDLVVPNTYVHTISVLMNNGDATFAPPETYGSGMGPQTVTIGDLNGNDWPDLAVANYFDDNVSVLMNNGDGTFAAAVHYDAGNTPRYHAAGDLNGDERPDLAVPLISDDKVSVLMNNGDGTFAAPAHYTAGDEPQCVTIADLDLDGWPDLTVVNFAADQVWVLPNNGDGTFAQPLQFGTGDAPGFVAAGDLNLDEWLDLAIANKDSDDASVLLNWGERFEITLPSSYTIVDGQLVSGGLEELFGSDDARLVVTHGGYYPPWIELEVRGTAPSASPSAHWLTFEGHPTSENIRQWIKMYNYDLQDWEMVDQRVMPASDEVINIVISDNPSRFVDVGTLEMKTRIMWMGTGFAGLYGWNAEIDQTVWRTGVDSGMKEGVLTKLGRSHPSPYGEPLPGFRQVTPAVTKLEGVSPSPFRAYSTIAFALAEAQPVTVRIYSVAGKLVRELVNEHRATGRHALRWDGRDDAGRAVSAGVYYVRMQTRMYGAVQRLVLLR